MPLQRFTRVYGIQDAKIAPLTADPATGTPTYGALIDVPGIKTFEISGDVEVKKLRGDNTQLATNAAISNIQVAVTHAKMSLDVLAAIVGGTVTDSGTTPAQKTSWDLTSDNAIMPPFKLEGVTPPNGVDIIGGDCHVVLHKLTLSAFPDLGFSEEDYRIASFTADADPLLSNKKWISTVLNETAAAIA
ncbi:phage tail protein [Streptomyces sp. DSM 41014]|uniref:Phage tail protein n=1 Tax=Streptomyces hintoniae TaxID=3075521 RepID=A0ABU2UIL6_9ACTN|nr:phage tail protein [Streptomyces sp. DSM 41014]MDT0473010.1 phage tail protein [Streptomyces sp. DSM 41014]